MDISITEEFIREKIQKKCYEISLHADNERIADKLTIFQLEFALSNCEILERYSDDPRGESCLVLGFNQDGNPVHIVCGKNPSEHLFVITVYIPKMPKWKDPYRRNK